MPQVQLPVFPPGTTAITAELGFERKEKQVVYLNGHLPVFTHQVDDLGSFRFFTSQLIANGTASHGQIAEAFGVPLVTVKRYYRRFREQAGAFQPFFVVTQAVDPGLRKVLEEQIAPRLLQEVPGQPTEVELAANCYLRRFSMIFDREGFSPEMFKRLWELRIAVITYRKFAKDLWDPEEFVLRKVRLVNGEEVEMELAERGVRLSNGLWVREIRRQDPETGHQTAIITTDYLRDLTGIAAAMFARWCQENFFQYMAEHFGLDRLIVRDRASS